MIVVIDNYDSFTWNLVHTLGAAMSYNGVTPVVGSNLVVARNDAVTADGLETIADGSLPRGIVISPGPCTPREAGVSGEIVRRFAGRVPLLGVCLGHQVIATEFGMRVNAYARPVHGKTTRISHDGRGLFTNLPNPLDVARYHSLLVEPASVPQGWAVSAWTDDGSIMGLRRVWDTSGQAMLEGVQFHPESFMTPHGGHIAANFVRSCLQNQRAIPSIP